MALKRTKRADIYGVVGKFYGDVVLYAAHAILNDGTAILLQPTAQGDGGTPFNHPDQTYWRDNGARIRRLIEPRAANIKRIEIDCTLLPCVQVSGCMTTVPNLIRQLSPAFADIALRIFSYRREITARNLPPGDKSDHRYFDTSTRVGTDQQAAYNNNRGWGWVSTGFSDRQYAEDFQAII